jgi:hypothetical protein
MSNEHKTLLLKHAKWYVKLYVRNKLLDANKRKKALPQMQHKMITSGVEGLFCAT